jgi:hypothetical protein
MLNEEEVVYLSKFSSPLLKRYFCSCVDTKIRKKLFFSSSPITIFVEDLPQYRNLKGNMTPQQEHRIYRDCQNIASLLQKVSLGKYAKEAKSMVVEDEEE